MCIVDEEDYARVSTVEWIVYTSHLHGVGDVVYAYIDGKHTSMGAYILGGLGGRMYAKHVNGDNLDNRRNNLIVGDRLKDIVMSSIEALKHADDVLIMPSTPCCGTAVLPSHHGACAVHRILYTYGNM